MSEANSRIRKLLTLALDKSASEEEASSAAALFIKLARKESMSVDQLMAAGTTDRIVYVYVEKPAPPPAYQPPPPPKSSSSGFFHESYKGPNPLPPLRMPFGKYKGMFMPDIWASDPQYCHWLYYNCERLSGRLKSFLQEKLGAL